MNEQNLGAPLDGSASESPATSVAIETGNSSTKFDDLGLSQALLNCVKELGFSVATPIQAAVIPEALKGRDIIGLAKTGSGKTAAFVIPMAEKLQHEDGLRGLILCPTREIALQTKKLLDIFGRHHDLTTVCLIGGMKMGQQIEDLKKTPDIVVATPGRLLDHARARRVDLRKITELVLDEADHMLDMGFWPQITEILSMLTEERHTMMFSATMPDKIDALARRFLRDPLRVDILPPGRTAEGIKHELYLFRNEHRHDGLIALITKREGSLLVFTRTKLDADWLCRTLEDKGFSVSSIHSDRSQSERTSALEGFRTGKHRVLVATGILARGIDVPNIEHIVNFGFPDTVEEYIHRAGRTARGEGVIGTVATIASFMEKPLATAVEGALGHPLPRCQVEGVPAFQELTNKPRPSGRRR